MTCVGSQVEPEAEKETEKKAGEELTGIGMWETSCGAVLIYCFTAVDNAEAACSASVLQPRLDYLMQHEFFCSNCTANGEGCGPDFCVYEVFTVFCHVFIIISRCQYVCFGS